MKPQAIRDLMFELNARGKSKIEIADILGVKKNTIYRWLKAGNINLPARGPRLGKRSMNDEQEQSLLRSIESNPSMTQADLKRHVREMFGITVSRYAVSRVLGRAGITRKKAVKRNSEYIVDRGRLFLDELKVLFASSPGTLASIDEASFHLNSAPRYAWARRGQRAVVTRPMVRGKRFSLLLCVCPSGVLDYTLVEGSINSSLFTIFLSTLRPDLTLLLDNVSIHKATKSLWKKGLPSIRESAEARSITLKYTVPYAPHLNPVEFCFNTVRSFINRREPRTEEDLRQAVAEAIRSIRPESLDRLFKKVIYGDP